MRADALAAQVPPDGRVMCSVLVKTVIGLLLPLAPRHVAVGAGRGDPVADLLSGYGGAMTTTVKDTVHGTDQHGTDRPRDPGSRLIRAAGAVPGAAIGAALGALAAVRRNKPVHPKGRVGAAELEVTTPRPEFGVPLLSSNGTHACTARFSRTVGLPASWPDIEGLAVRFEDPTADVLFASTGIGRLGRFVFKARSADKHGPQTTFLPVSTSSGSLLLRMTPLDQADPPVRWELSAAHVGSEWRPVGVLHVTWGVDQPVRFDPVENLMPGTWQYPLVQVLREPSYALSRRLVRRPRS